MFLINNAFADTATAGPAGGFGSLIIFLPLILLFYFLLIRPQQKRQKQHMALLKSIVRGDKIVTNGGIVGVVCKPVSPEDTDITVEISEGVAIKVVRNMIANVIRENKESAPKSKSKSKDAAKSKSTHKEDKDSTTKENKEKDTSKTE